MTRKRRVKAYRVEVGRKALGTIILKSRHKGLHWV